MSGKERPIGIYARPSVPMYTVRVTVVKSHPKCKARHKIGDTWEISHVKRGGQKGFICPSALHSLYFLIHALRYGAEFPMWKDRDSKVDCCACDSNVSVGFKLERLRDRIWRADQKLIKINNKNKL
jgi:uncharacterized repeat protein (TIGR04076 family)